MTNDLKVKFNPFICPGRTDLSYLREAGVPAIGFSPMNNTPVLMHDNNEFISVQTFLEGIEIYKTLIPKLAAA